MFYNKKIESTTNHDVKAVEYYIRDYFLKDKVLSICTSNPFWLN